jgi:MFS family permease
VTAAPTPPPLRKNRDFNLLWAGQVLSDLGGRVSGVAFPLLVLALTGSPARAGIVASAETLPLLVLTLPAGALVDRWNRKRVMIAVDAVRCVALASIAVALAFDALSFAQIVVVALLEGSGFAFFNVAERSALPSVVADVHLEAAIGRNQAREYVASLAGAPLGGALFGVARLAPFVFDAVSYLASLAALLLIRTPFRRDPLAEAPGRVFAELRAGLRWFWRQPFIRTTTLLAMGSDVTLNALYLVVIVIARERGASPALIGAMFAFVGLGGVLGSLIAARLAAAVSIRTIVVATQCAVAVLVPLLAVVPGRVGPGIVFGAMFFLFPPWNAAVGSQRLRLTPDELRGRISSIGTMLSLGPVTIGSAATGFLLERAGSTPTVLVFAALMGGVAAAAVRSRSIAAR